jgi:hypothetical protein
LGAVDLQLENAAMHRVKHPPAGNKIDLADPAQVRAWARRLAVSADGLKAVVDKVDNSIAVGDQGSRTSTSSPPNFRGADPIYCRRITASLNSRAERGA